MSTPRADGDRVRADMRRARIDFVTEIVSIDEATHTFEARLVPDPRRYEWRTMDDGQVCLYDLFDHTRFPNELLASLAEQMQGQPIYAETPQIGSAAEYVEQRRAVIDSLLRRGGVEASQSAAAALPDHLSALRNTSHDFAVLAVDMVGATRLGSDLAPDDYARLMTTVLHELTAVVPEFRGYVLKTTGDGLIAYFPAPSFITKNDLSFDCALTMLRLVRDGINPVLPDHGLPGIGVRVGIESGAVEVRVIGSPQAGQRPDLVGHVVNMAAKLQSVAPEGGVAVGWTCLRNLHTSWRVLCNPIPTPAGWPYVMPNGRPYPVHVCMGLAAEECDAEGLSHPSA